MSARTRCERCAAEQPLEVREWRCPCGGPLQIWPPPVFGPGDVDHEAPGLWRYAALLPAVAPGHRVSLGEARTPAVPGRIGGREVIFKLEHQQASGSYKARGAAPLACALRQAGVESCVEDSSGNAAAALSAYAAACGVHCAIYAPAGNSPGKLSQPRAHGAAVHLVEGSRDDVEAAAIAAAGDGAAYVGHNWHPVFLAGCTTLAYDLYEQFDASLPDAIVLPVGYGNLMIGLVHGFEALLRGEAIDRLPAVHAIQTERFRALADAWAAGEDDVAASGTGPTIAEGIEARRPVRATEALRCLRATGGSALAVPEAAIREALAGLVAAGHYVEPTSAVAAAGVSALDARGALAPDARVVAVLTGTAHKTAAAVEQILSA